MRLYTLTGATQVDDPKYGRFTAGDDGAFEFPNEMSDQMHGFHVGGRAAWETDAERATRLASEELERLRDPATLLAVIQGMSANQQALAAALTTSTAPGPTPEKPVAEPVEKTKPVEPKPSPNPEAKTTAVPAKTRQSRTRKGSGTSPE